MTHAFRVSVIIPTYNRAAYLREAIGSALGQTVPVEEVVVVDDGSTDGTRELVREMRGPVRYLFQENAGCGAARNRAIREAKGDWIALLDSDDLWVPGKIEAQSAFLSLHPEVDFVFGNLANFRGEARLMAPEILDRRVHADLRANAADARNLFRHLMTSNPVAVSSVVLRKSIFERFGSFDETLRCCEDLECWLRIASRCRIGYVDATLVMRRLHDTNMILDRALRYESRLGILERVRRDHPTLPPETRRALMRGVAIATYQLALHYRAAGDDDRARHFLGRVRPLHLLPDWRAAVSAARKRLLPAKRRRRAGR